MRRPPPSKTPARAAVPPQPLRARDGGEHTAARTTNDKERPMRLISWLQE